MFWKRVLLALAAVACTIGIGLARSGGDGPPPRAGQGGAPATAGRPELVVAAGGSTGVGISYMPLVIMREERLLEKHAASLGLDATLRWERFPSAGAMYDALLSGKLAFASGGVTQLLTSWDRTRSGARVRGVAALNAMPLSLVTSNPRVRTIADFKPKDRIALPAVRTSIQAVVLAMAEEKAFGKGRAGELDPLTVALGHPEATAAILGGKSDVDAHFSSAPFMYEELAKPAVHEVLNSYAVLGGPHTYNAVWTTTVFHDAHPKAYEAFVGALQEALERIRADPAAAAAIWVKAEGVKDLSAKQVEEIIRKPGNEWTTTPKKFMAFAKFMDRNGLISTEPADWRELFFDNVKAGG